VTRRTGLALAALAASLVLAGCGSDAATQTSAKVRKADNPANARTVTITGGGDILIHNTLGWQAEAAAGHEGLDADFRPMLAGIKKRISRADFSICHLEHQISDPHNETTFPHLYQRPQLIDAIKRTGYDECSTVSNWGVDKGYAGIKRTLDKMDSEGIGHAGSARTKAEAGRINIQTVKGVKIAHLAYSGDFNGEALPDKYKWAANLASPKRIIGDAQKARRQGAKVVVVSLHMGDADTHEPSAGQLKMVNAATAGGLIDLIIGHGSHQVMPVAKVNGTWVVYGHGNTVSGQKDEWVRNREGLLSWFSFAKQPNGRFKAVVARGYPLYDSSTPYDHAVDLVSAWPKDSDPPQRWIDAYRRVKQTALSMGAAKQGFVVPAHG